jgi:hypothetical protein
MPHRTALLLTATGSLIFWATPFNAFGQQGADAPARPAKQESARVTRPPLFLEETWKQTPAGGEHPVTPESIGNPNLELKLYGPVGKMIQLTGSAQDENNPTHVWTGLCTAPCAFTLRDKNNYVDLTGLARIRLVTKVSGLHQVHPMVRLADGTVLVGSRADGSVADWIESEFAVAEVRWLHLDPERLVTTGNWVEHPDLSRVDEVGFVDLMPSSGHGPGGWSDVGRVVVYGKPVKRS